MNTLIVIENQDLRDASVRLLSEYTDKKNVFAVGSGKEALIEAVSSKPQIVFIEYGLGDMKAVKLYKELNRLLKDFRCIFLYSSELNPFKEKLEAKIRHETGINNIRLLRIDELVLEFQKIMKNRGFTQHHFKNK